MESYLVQYMAKIPTKHYGGFRKGQCNFQEPISGVVNPALGAPFQHQLNRPGPANKGLQDQ